MFISRSDEGPTSLRRFRNTRQIVTLFMTHYTSPHRHGAVMTLVSLLALQPFSHRPTGAGPLWQCPRSSCYPFNPFPKLMTHRTDVRMSVCRASLVPDMASPAGQEHSICRMKSSASEALAYTISKT